MIMIKKMTKIIQNLRKNEYEPMKIVGYDEERLRCRIRMYAIKAKNVTVYKTVRLVDWNPDQIPAQIIDIAKEVQFRMLNSRIAI